jgi:hypothetical protein
MNKWRIICPLVAILVALLVFGAIQGRKEHRYFISMATGSIGNDLIAGTNSSALVPRPNDNGMLLHLQGRLSDLHSSPLHIAAVLLGDEPRPTGDGSACSRLVLTNEAADGILIRLRQAKTGGNFEVLGYLQVSEHRSQ